MSYFQSRLSGVWTLLMLHFLSLSLFLSLACKPERRIDWRWSQILLPLELESQQSFHYRVNSQQFQGKFKCCPQLLICRAQSNLQDGSSGNVQQRRFQYSYLYRYEHLFNRHYHHCMCKATSILVLWFQHPSRQSLPKLRPIFFWGPVSCIGLILQ